MPSARVLGARSAAAALLTAVLGGCLGLVEVQDSALGACNQYCDLIDARCNGSNRVYDRRDACMAVCMRFDPGNYLGGGSSDTLACRGDRLVDQAFEPVTDCDGVGPGGDGSCATNCEALCTLRQQVCGSVEGQEMLLEVLNHDSCVQNCSGLLDLGSLDTARDVGGDSVQCRLVHVSEAAISPALAEQHCPLSQIIPDPGELSACSDPADVPRERNCQAYCALVMEACQAGTAVYESKQQCFSVCALLDPGEPGDLNGNSVRCRRYHAYNALSDPSVHCPHAGPTGDGHCGSDNCPSYCRILSRACPVAFVDRFGDDGNASDRACNAECETLPGAPANGFLDLGYDASRGSVGATLPCRTYHAVRALASPNDALECGAALGERGSSCAP